MKYFLAQCRLTFLFMMSEGGGGGDTFILN